MPRTRQSHREFAESGRTANVRLSGAWQQKAGEVICLCSSSGLPKQVPVMGHDPGVFAHAPGHLFQHLLLWESILDRSSIRQETFPKRAGMVGWRRGEAKEESARGGPRSEGRKKGRQSSLG